MRKFIVCIAAAFLAWGAQAQDLGSLLTGLKDNLVGDKLTDAQSVVGTWKYVAPECVFESDDVLAKAGGEALAVKAEQDLSSLYEKTGMDGVVYEFSDDGNFVCTVGKAVSRGTYTFDSAAKTLMMTTRLGLKMEASVAVVGQEMRLMFNADKLLSAVGALSGYASKMGELGKAVSAVAENYDGLKLGFRLATAR